MRLTVRLRTVTMAFAWASLLAVSGVGGAQDESKTVVFQDGTELEVWDYERQGGVVILITLEGRRQSIPVTLVDLEATEAANATPAAPPQEELPHRAGRARAPRPATGTTSVAHHTSGARCSA